MTKASGWHRKRSRTPGELAGRYNTAEHRAARTQFRLLVSYGIATCWRCGKQLVPGQWHVGHDDPGLRIMGPECASCNRKAAASKGAKIANARRKAAKFVRPVR